MTAVWERKVWWKSLETTTNVSGCACSLATAEHDVTHTEHQGRIWANSLSGRGQKLRASSSTSGGAEMSPLNMCRTPPSAVLCLQTFRPNFFQSVWSFLFGRNPYRGAGVWDVFLQPNHGEKTQNWFPDWAAVSLSLRTLPPHDPAPPWWSRKNIL